MVRSLPKKNNPLILAAEAPACKFRSFPWRKDGEAKAAHVPAGREA